MKVCVFHSKFSKDSDSSLYTGFLNANVCIAPFSGVNIKFSIHESQEVSKIRKKNKKANIRDTLLKKGIR